LRVPWLRPENSEKSPVFAAFTLKITWRISLVGHGPDFREAWEIQKIIDTAVQSSRLRTWQAIE